MPKMPRLPSVAATTVLIRVRGPKSILNDTNTLGLVLCDLEMTWIEFLQNNCRLNIQPDSPLIIKTVSTPKAGVEEWQAKLQDKVNDFIKKFTYVKKYYSIRLVLKSPVATLQQPEVNVPTVVSTAISTEADTPSMTLRKHTKSTMNNKLQVPAQVPIAFPSTSSSTRPIANSSEIRFQGAADRYPEDRFPTFTGGADGFNVNATNNPPISVDDVAINLSTVPNHNNMDDDAMSQMTSASVEENDLTRDGIVFNEIKPTVIQRMARNFDNATMLRIQHELRYLVRNGRWLRLTSKAPRTAHLLQDVFQICTSSNE